jgi:ribosomal protein S18 acetylase RimI-like enzyme
MSGAPIKVEIRKADVSDTAAVFQLFREVAKNESGIARMEEEITEDYIADIFIKVTENGLMLVGIEPVSENLIATIHASKYGIKIFDHILTSLTIVVHPNFQGKGIGKQMFSAFLQEVQSCRKDIGRIELETRSSNQSSVALYKSVGFIEEGRMKNKTRNKNGVFEDSLLMAWMNPEFSFR